MFEVQCGKKFNISYCKNVNFFRFSPRKMKVCILVPQSVTCRSRIWLLPFQKLIIVVPDFGCCRSSFWYKQGARMGSVLPQKRVWAQKKPALECAGRVLPAYAAYTAVSSV
ncbi:MAG: hypothetical protein K2J81_06220 [Treponemataceae bacterium]|nr:hypothetical protein [Treponemataceae bacterium]